jgi:N-acyl-D-amino-acid deacylase
MIVSSCAEYLLLASVSSHTVQAYARLQVPVTTAGGTGLAFTAGRCGRIGVLEGKTGTIIMPSSKLNGPCQEDAGMYDIVIGNGRLITGTGNPWFYGDVGLADGRVVAVGRIDEAEAVRSIDATGCYVCPGFIDGHSHSDLFIFVDPSAEQKVMQGVTTENVCMDGMSVAPIDERDIAGWRTHLSGLAGDPPIDWRWRSFADYLDAIDELGTSDNISSYVGLGTIRLKVMGMSDRHATPQETEAMRSLALQAMEEGARGVSSGLIYPPSQYQTLEEVVAVCKAVRHHDGVYDVHLRSEGDGLIAGMEEVIEIGRRSGIPIIVTHHKAMGRRNWGRSEQTLRMVDDARREGLDVSLEQYPYTAASTMLHAVIPPWYHARGPRRLIDDLKNDREKIKRDIRERTDWENWASSNGWENIVVSSVGSGKNKAYEGRNVVEVAGMRGQADPADTAMDLLVEEELNVGMVIFCMDEDDVTRIMAHPTVSIITDGLLGGKPHPRVYGTFPRVLGRYVREQGVLGLEEAVRKMTSATAQKLRLRSKGVLATGMDADVTVFRGDTVIDRATYEDPRQFSRGIEWVVVNGKVVVDRGRHTGARPGHTVRDR